MEPWGSLSKSVCEAFCCTFTPLLQLSIREPMQTCKENRPGLRLSHNLAMPLRALLLCVS